MFPENKMAFFDTNISNILFDSYASMNVKPEGGGGGTPAICGAVDLCCLPHPWEFD